MGKVIKHPENLAPLTMNSTLSSPTDSQPPQWNASSLPLLLMGIFYILFFVCCCVMWIKCGLCYCCWVCRDEAEASADTAVCVPVPVCVVVLEETSI